MARKRGKSSPAPGAVETGAVHKSWHDRIRVCLVYPNTYRVGMSNLGFHTVYRLLNEMDQVVCERAFLPPQTDRSRWEIVSQESGSPLGEFDLIALSISFESDYIHVLDILQRANLPLQAEHRGPPLPLVLAGRLGDRG